MKRINSVGKWVAPMLVLLISIIIFFYTSTITYKNIGTNELFATVDAITRGYKIKQIIASVVLFIAGYLVAQGTFDKQTDAMKAAWAVPIAVVGWCMCSAVILLLRLPYIRSFAFGLVGALLGAMIYIRKEYIKKDQLGRTMQIYYLVRSIIYDFFYRNYSNGHVFGFLLLCNAIWRSCS